MGFISFIFLSFLFCSGWTYDSFNDWPLKIEPGNYRISATLTDQENGEKFLLEEYIQVNMHRDTKSRTKIETGNASPIYVHYNHLLPGKRIVIQDNDCDVFTYDHGRWNKQIPGTSGSLINHLLLVGPSIMYRLKSKSFVWNKGNDTVIRGTTMHSAFVATWASKLVITYFYKGEFEFDIDLTKPSAITFYGVDPNENHSTIYQNLLLDIYQINDLDKNIEPKVLRQPGIGCSVNSYWPEHALNSFIESAHFISSEHALSSIQSSTTNEFFIDSINQMLFVKKISKKTKSETIYDYDLRITYSFDNNGLCEISPMGLDAPGISLDSDYKKLSIQNFFDDDLIQEKLGKTYFNNREGATFDTWESVSYNYTTSRGKFDKFVTTLFTIDPFLDGEHHIPIGEIVNAYNQASNGKYILAERIVKEVYEYDEDISDEVHSGQFRTIDCYPDPSDRKTLALHFKCDGLCNQESIPSYKYRRLITNALSMKEIISASRIGNIEIVRDTDKVIAYVTFLNFPSIKKILKASNKVISKDTIKRAHTKVTKDETECLKLNSKSETEGAFIVYCKEDKTCSRFDKIDQIKEVKTGGTRCTVYHNPFKNLKRHSQELKLDNILSDLNSIVVRFIAESKKRSSLYKLSHADEVNQSGSPNLFSIEREGMKFVKDETSNFISKTVKNFADCYRACAQFDNKKCEIFSYCHYTEKVECLLSPLIYPNVTDKLVYDPLCTISRKNILDDYIKVENRTFTMPIRFSSYTKPEDCASECYSSNECFAFQVCNNKCAFGGAYTDSSTKYSDDCDIYIPKSIQKYSRSGTKIVVQTYHTESSLTLDQCAGLCHESKVSDEVCVSFNFCQGDATLCSLSKYSVKDLTTVTNYTDKCTNYELRYNNEKNRNKNTQGTETKGTSAKAAFGIVMLFIVIGLTTGFVGPTVYSKSSTNFTTFKQKKILFWQSFTNESEQAQSTI